MTDPSTTAMRLQPVCSLTTNVLASRGMRDPVIESVVNRIVNSIDDNALVTFDVGPLRLAIVADEASDERSISRLVANVESVASLSRERFDEILRDAGTLLLSADGMAWPPPDPGVGDFFGDRPDVFDLLVVTLMGELSEDLLVEIASATDEEPSEQDLVSLGGRVVSALFPGADQDDDVELNDLLELAHLASVLVEHGGVVSERLFVLMLPQRAGDLGSALARVDELFEGVTAEIALERFSFVAEAEDPVGSLRHAVVAGLSALECLAGLASDGFEARLAIGEMTAGLLSSGAAPGFGDDEGVFRDIKVLNSLEEAGLDVAPAVASLGVLLERASAMPASSGSELDVLQIFASLLGRLSPETASALGALLAEPGRLDELAARLGNELFPLAAAPLPLAATVIATAIHRISHDLDLTETGCGAGSPRL